MKTDLNANKIKAFREHLQKSNGADGDYTQGPSDFGQALCFEIHGQPINPRMRCKTCNDGFQTGLTFKELAAKWGISVTFLGELIADHCRRLEE